MDLEDKLRHERNRALKEGIEHGREQGIKQGIETGRKETLISLVHSGALTLQAAAAAAGMSEETFREELESQATR